jgi:hypothetical protein
MNREDIIKLAREADINVDGDVQGCVLRFICVENDLERFAALVAAAEREACAKVCKEVLEQYRGTDMGKHAEMVGDNCAAAIRERGQG